AMDAEWRKAKNGPRREEIEQARSDLASAEADLRLANEDFDRAWTLYRKAAVSRAEFESAREGRDRVKGRVASARFRLALLEAGTRPEEIDAAQAQLEEAKGKLQEIEANLAEALVRAPERCLVEVVAVRKGDLVAPNSPVVRVLRAEDMWVKVYVP